MPRRAVRILPAFAVAVGLLPGCHVDHRAIVGHDGLEMALDLGTARLNADNPAPRLPPPPPAAATLQERLKVPGELPGADADPIKLPKADDDKNREAHRKAIVNVFGEPMPLPADPTPDAPLLALDKLQRQASDHHPILRQAAAAVESARGAALQAGLPPNPSFGFEADTVGSGGTAGQQGLKLEQLIKTAGKLKLAQTAATIDVVNAEVALRRARLDLATTVRSAYYAALVAQEQARVATVVCRFSDETLRVQVDQVAAGQAAAYEPLQLRALAAQARVALTLANNRYQATWRQLAAAVGQPDLPCAPLDGWAAEPVPALPYEAVRERMLGRHTDIRTALNGVLKAQYALKLAQATPVPDVALKLVVQKDYTTPPFGTTTNVEIGVPIPVWDRNQGGIHQAEAELAKVLEEAGRVKLDLLGKLAEANERYVSNKAVVDVSRSQVLPDLVRAYRGVLTRYQQEPDKVSFDDVFLAQQTLTTAVMTYLNALSALWQAVVDVAGLAQSEDLTEFARPK